MKFLAAAFITVSSWAGNSLTLTGTTGLLVVPSAAPYTSVAGNRWEFRFHNFTTPSSNKTLFALAGGNINIEHWSSGEVCVTDTVVSASGRACTDLTGESDVTIRYARNSTTHTMGLTAFRTSDWTAIPAYCGWKSNGGSGFSQCEGASTTAWNFAGTTSFANGVTGQIAWLKWFAVDTTSTAMSEFSTATLADFRFDGSIAPSAGTVSITGIASPTFTSTPNFAPRCTAGASGSFRAGVSKMLDGSESFGRGNGGTLNFLWQILSGPSQARLAGQTTATPTLDGSVSGSYTLQLSVDDGSLSSLCTTDIGFAASDGNGAIVHGDDSAALIIGPLIRYGTSPWPWMDTISRSAADNRIAQMDTYYGAWWKPAYAGTLAVTNGSTAVVGTGTAFRTTMCTADGSARKYASSILIVWWTNPEGNIGHHATRVGSCADDTHLTLDFAWSHSTASGLNYSYYDDSVGGTWHYSASPANYYDNVMGFYALFHRTGLVKYRDAARKLADRFWECPEIDQGYGPQSLMAWQARSLALTGLVLRALDGRPDMWPGLRLLFDYNISLMGGDIVSSPVTYIPDAREAGYHLAFVSLCALYDPDATHKATCKAAVANHLATVWTVNPGTATKGGVGSFPMLAYSWASWAAGGGGNGGSLTVTNGSTTVQGVGTSWTSQFNFAGSVVDVAGVNQPICIMPGGTSIPADNSAFSGGCYTIAALNTDTQVMTISPPYAGTSGTGRGWAITFMVPLDTQALIGYGNQPFFLGIIAGAMYYASLAMDDGAYSPSTASTARTYIGHIRNWLENNAYRSSTKGLYYGAGFANCQLPVNETLTHCTAGGLPESRNMNAEAMRAVMHTYQNSPDPATRDFGDLLYTSMFSKPGAGGIEGDGDYEWYWDNFFNGGTPPGGTAPKWFGMYFGFGSLAGWPAVRIGGPIVVSGTHSITFSLPAGATFRRLILTRPDGKVVTTDCTSSPCSFQYWNYGTHLIRWEDRNPAGIVADNKYPIVLSL